MVLRDLLASVISGVTINTATSTATDLIRAVVTETSTGNYLNVNVSGSTGGSYPTSPTFVDVNITGNLFVTGNTYETDQYVTSELIIGNKTTLGSWRFIQSGPDLIVGVLTDVTGQTWTTKGSFLGT